MIHTVKGFSVVNEAEVGVFLELSCLIYDPVDIGLPFYRQIEMMKRQGMNIPPSTINDWFFDVADLLRPLYFRIRDLVMQTDYIQADETTVPIVDDEKHKTVKGYLWQVCSVMEKLMFFHYDKGSRSRDVALGLFAHFRGALQTDGYAVYDYYE